MLLPDAMRQHSAAYWQRVSDHIDPYAAIMVDRRASVTVNRPILGIDGDTAAIRMPEADEPLLALGVGGSGKTASVITVNALLSPGPLVSTSSRSDVYLATALSRARVRSRVASNGKRPSDAECISAPVVAAARLR